MPDREKAMGNKNQYIKGDRIAYYSLFSKANLLDWLFSTEQYWIRKFLIALRSEEYYTFKEPNKLLRFYYFRRKNIIGRKLGFFIPAGCFDLGLHISHYGSIIINPKARIGKNCTIHGNCCIGNRGDDASASPILGENIDLGQGAQVLGAIHIANGAKIGAGSIVLHSIETENAVVVGIPGKVMGL